MRRALRVMPRHHVGLWWRRTVVVAGAVAADTDVADFPSGAITGVVSASGDATRTASAHQSPRHSKWRAHRTAKVASPNSGTGNPCRRYPGTAGPCPR